MPATYSPIARTYLSSTQPTISFSNINPIYTDLVVVCNYALQTGGGFGIDLRINGDSGSNYSRNFMIGGSGSNSQSSNRYSNETYGNAGSGSGTVSSAVYMYFMNYSNTTNHKVWINHEGGASGNGSGVVANTWRSNSAINSLEFFFVGNNNNFLSDTTITLYGVRAATPS